MKKVTLFLLLFTMCFGLIAPNASLSASAEESAPSYLNVSLVSTNDTRHLSGMNAETVFQDNDIVYQGKNADEGMIIVGKLDGYHSISRITIRTSANLPNRTKGCYLEASADGENWVTLAQQTTAADKETWFHLDVTDKSPYLYVRIRQDIGYRNYDLSITSLLFEGEPSKTLPVTFVESNYDGTNDRGAAHCFSEDTTYYSAQGKVLEAGGREPVYGLGKLVQRSRISKVICFAHPQYAARMRGMTVWASKDGTSWDLLATLPSSITANQRYEFDVSPNTYYQYVKFEQSKVNAANGEWFSVGYVLFEGEMFSESQGAVLQGWQQSVKVTDTYSLRFICSVNSLDYQAVGMKIHAATQDGTVRDYDVKATTVYQSISGMVNGEPTQITAQDFDSSYIYTVVVQGIPTNLGLTSFHITPYVITDGETMEGTTGQVVFQGAEPAQSTVYDLKEHQDSIRVSGRSHTLSNGIACDFSASGIEFQAMLAGDLCLTANCTATTYYTLYLNGERQPQRLVFHAGTAEYTLAENLPAGMYDVKLVKQTHVVHSLSTLLSVKVCGSLSEAAPAQKNHLIEFVGDSITCGYGVVGYPAPGVTYYGTSEYCDATQAYAYKTAGILNTDYSMVSVSGWAVLPSAEGVVEGCVPAIYNQTSWQRSDEQYAPGRTADIVVIHLGTNDVSSRSNYSTDFVDAAKALVAQVQAMNPHAKIIWAYGSMMKDDQLADFQSKIQTMIQDLGGAENGYYSVQLPYNQSAGNGHPNAQGHTDSAEVLAQFISDNHLLSQN